MRLLFALMMASVMLLGVAGCGADPADNPDFKEENINPSNVRMGGDVPIKNAPPGQ